jgi:hypothetical protein
MEVEIKMLSLHFFLQFTMFRDGRNKEGFSIVKVVMEVIVIQK